MGADRSDRNGLSVGVGIGERACIHARIRVTGDIASYCFKPDICAQHGIAVDRFAREIGPFLKSSCAARSRQLNAKPLGGWGNVVNIPFGSCQVAVQVWYTAS